MKKTHPISALAFVIILLLFIMPPPAFAYKYAPMPDSMRLQPPPENIKPDISNNINRTASPSERLTAEKNSSAEPPVGSETVSENSPGGSTSPVISPWQIIFLTLALLLAAFIMKWLFHRPNRGDVK